MSGSLLTELLLFCRFAGMGAALCFFYSVLVAFRQVIPHGKAAVALEDISYWLASGFFVFAQMYGSCQGNLRGFLFLGMVSGAFVYSRSLGRFFQEICRRFLAVPVFLLKKIRNLLLFCGKRGKLLVNIPVKRYRDNKQANSSEKQ